MNDFTDPAGIALLEALNVDAILNELRQTLPECKEGLQLIEAKIQDVQYKPGVTCRILYRIKCRESGSGRTTHQYLSARLLGRQENFPDTPEDLIRRYHSKRKTFLKTPVIVLSRPRMVFYSFPIDPALPALMDVLDPELFRNGLKKMWARRNVHVLNTVVDLLSYTPQARAAVISEVLSESRDRREPEVRRLVGKIHAYKRPSQMFAGSWGLWRSLNRRIKMAAPVGYISSLNLTLQEQVRGERLPDLAHKRTFVKPVRHAARAIAMVHSLKVPLNSSRSPEKEASVVHRWKPVLTAICPQRTAHIEKFCNQLSEDLIDQTRVTGPVHGDFHPANVMWDGQDVTLIDLDEMSYGDPLLDIGRFLASLRVSALRVSSDLASLTSIQEAFLEEYFIHMPGDLKRVRLFEAASLLIAAASPFRLQRAGWKEATEMLLDEANRVWTISNRLTRATGESKERYADPAPIEFDWSQDGVYMQGMLDESVQNAFGAELTYCRVQEATPPALARYDLRGERAGEKWGTSAEAISWEGKGARTLVHFLTECRRSTDIRNMPLLPLPICHLKPFSLIVLEMLKGLPLSFVLSNQRNCEDVLARVGASLATLHGIDIDLKTTYSNEEYLQRLSSRLDKLQNLRPDLLQKTQFLMPRVREVLADSIRQSPVLRKLHPDQILLLDSKIAFTRVERMTMAHPFLDLSEMMVRLSFFDRAPYALLKGYDIKGSERYELAGFQIGAMLRHACKQADRDPGSPLVDRLLCQAMNDVSLM